MRGSPQQPNPERPGMSIPTKITFDPLEKEDPDPQVPLRKETRTRKFRITPQMLGDYGHRGM